MWITKVLECPQERLFSRAGILSYILEDFIFTCIQPSAVLSTFDSNQRTPWLLIKGSCFLKKGVYGLPQARNL